ncbi:unnamed protein product [Allacma fusca]|uniref:Uncharacterized protein n=1 Tax=Allacma fusca TaxID=39272 RepID=A0A8J2JLY3_9HEXA|nr:unnamed protein product [Allacma fusca]
MCKCWKADPSERPKFTDLTKEFLRLLPKEYVKTIPEKVYEPPTLNMAELGTLFPKPENTAVIFKDKDIIAENNNSCFKYLTIFLNRHGDT